MNEDELEFALFCIEHFADYLRTNGAAVYKMLSEESDCLDKYIIGCYQTLHTQGKEYILDDITEYLRLRGIAV